MARRNGYTDFAIPMKTLRKKIKDHLGDDRTMAHEARVDFIVDNFLDGPNGIFEANRRDFLSYIATNALTQAEGDERAAGVDPRTGTRTEPQTKPRAEPLPAAVVSAEKIKAEKEAKDRLTDLAPILFMKLPTPFGKPLGELTGKEGRKLSGALAGFFKGVPDGKRLCDVKGEAQLRTIWQKLK